MSLTLFLLTVVTLSFIALQDFRSRAVSWFLFPLLAVCGVSMALIEGNALSSLGQYMAINSAFLLMQFAVLKGWFLLRAKRGIPLTGHGKGPTPFVDHAIGKGDIFFLLAAGCFFSPVNFIFFYLSSLLFALIAYLLVRYRPTRKPRWSTVPLAGLQAGFLLLCLPLHLLLRLPLTDDSWITLKLLYP
jgi:Flp pilus assembly protein protease CpaA